MGDMREIGEAMRELSKERRKSNRENSARILREAGFAFETKNGGAHLIVTLGLTFADFWPGTGLYQIRGGRQARGVYKMMDALRKAEAARG